MKQIHVGFDWKIEKIYISLSSLKIGSISQMLFSIMMEIVYCSEFLLITVL